MSDEKECWACKTSLVSNQLICLECKSWQHWRRFINSTSAIVTTLVLVGGTVATVGSSVLATLRKDQTPFISAGFSIRDDHIALRVTNLGEKAIVFEQDFECRTGRVDQNINLDNFVDYYIDEPVVVFPNETDEFKYNRGISIDLAEDEPGDPHWECRAPFNDGRPWVLVGINRRSSLGGQIIKIIKGGDGGNDA